MGPTIIDSIRHGEPVGGRRYRGNGVDDPLSGDGWAQMRAALGDGAPWTGVVTSPLVRCRAFAEQLAERRGLPLVVETELREIGFGAWEGLTPSEVEAKDPEAFRAYRRSPADGRPAGAEPLTTFQNRVVQAYRGLLEPGTGGHLLVVAHAGVIRAMLGHFLQSPPGIWYRVQVDYGGITRFCHDETGARLVFHNAWPGEGLT